MEIKSGNPLRLGPPNWLHPDLSFLWDYAVERGVEEAEARDEDPKLMKYTDFIIILKAVALKYAKILDLGTLRRETRLGTKKTSMMLYMDHSSKDPEVQKRIQVLLDALLIMRRLVVLSRETLIEKKLTAFVEQYEGSSLLSSILKIYPFPVPRSWTFQELSGQDLLASLKRKLEIIKTYPGSWPEYPGVESAEVGTELLIRLIQVFIDAVRL